MKRARCDLTIMKCQLPPSTFLEHSDLSVHPQRFLSHDQTRYCPAHTICRICDLLSDANESKQENNCLGSWSLASTTTSGSTSETATAISILVDVPIRCRGCILTTEVQTLLVQHHPPCPRHRVCGNHHGRHGHLQHHHVHVRMACARAHPQHHPSFRGGERGIAAA